MSIELKQAAQQAVDAFNAFGDADDFASLFELTQKMRALSTAIQQAEAQTGEPVDFPAGAIINGRTLMERLEAYPFESQGGDLRMCSDWHELRRCFEHLSDYASTHPAPGVSDGWKEATIAWEVCASIHRQWAKGKDAFFSTRQADYIKHAENSRAMFDAAMIASPVQKGQP